MNQELLKLIIRIERIAQEMEYGTMTCNVVVSKGKPKLETFYITTSKRKKYPPGKGTLTEEDQGDKS